MPYFTITDFAAGLDVRRSSLTAPAGTLRKLTNAHVTPGGEIEKRFSFYNFKTVPANTRGLVSVNQKLYVFAPMTQEQIYNINPAMRLDSQAYLVGQCVTVNKNISRIFTCTVAGTTAATEPAAYATAVDGTVIVDGSATFVASTPPGWTTSAPPRVSSHAYTVGETIRVVTNPSRIFTCSVAGTSAASEPTTYAIAIDGVDVVDGTATFVGSTPPGGVSGVNPPPPMRNNSRSYTEGESITVNSNEQMVFECEVPGTSAAIEPPEYATAVTATEVIDGTCHFLTSTAAVRENSHGYGGGDLIRVPSNSDLLFTCATAGSTAATEPPGYATATAASVIVDGTAVFRHDPMYQRQSGKAYALDEHHWENGSGFRWKCVTAGTTAATSPPGYSDGSGGVTISDGTLVSDGTATFEAHTYARANSTAYAVGDHTTVAGQSTGANGFNTCVVAGTSAATAPPEFLTPSTGSVVTDGTATFRAQNLRRVNSVHYSPGAIITVASNIPLLFTCTTGGDAAAAEPPAYASAVDATLIVDGSTKFRTSQAARISNHLYNVDQLIKVAAQPKFVFICTTSGTTAETEPPLYSTATDGVIIFDGSAAFRAIAPPNWIVDAQPPIVPIKTEPTSLWDVGILPLETTTLFEIIDYDLFDNKVFVTAWRDAAGNVVRCYDGKAVPAAQGFYVKTYKTKIFTVGGSVLYFSAIGNPADWTGTGSGMIDLSLEDSDMTDCIALEAYYDKLAIISKTATQLWLIDPDPLRSQYVQTLRDAGTIAWRSVLQYGSGDVMYLSPSGIRSLRARNSSLAAAVSDIGSPLDPILQDLFRTRDEAVNAGTISLLQPVTGRFWIIMPDRIYVLSAFPGPKITAWSEYELTHASPTGQVSFAVTAGTTYRHHVVLRDGEHNIYAYGGTDPAGPVYDDASVELIFPHHAGDQPATYKMFQALDAACTGNWEVSLSLNPDDDAVEDFAGVFTGQQFTKGDFPITAQATHMSLRLRCFETGPASLSNLIVHYQIGQSRGIGL
jgi:hypothetical protein